jgi:hypothetical protein
MLYVCLELSTYAKFKELFSKSYEGTFLDLSKVPSYQLADEVDSIVGHHSKCFVFLGYLEPGWMLEPAHQTRIRKLFRKFPVAIMTHFVESLPFSWKNEIDILYTGAPLNKNGKANSLNDGSSIQEQSKL